jgi:hypothetical protein
MPAGRPTTYTQDLADRLCEQLADGKSLRKVCLADDMPGKRTVFKWLRTNEEFRHQYETAKDECADVMVEEITEIADDSTNDYMMELAEAIEEKPASEWTPEDIKILAMKLAPENIQRSRLRVDARKWAASKLKPKKYGDRITHAGDAENPLVCMPIEFVNASKDTTAT